ncbi:uncharacterized protein TRIVIDRAFT_199310 [Trichoderma virens Gv29-8]|uniref:Uncharacterized protein n=1 Tax=Hypocrea virens (strain Gv29-8 / FGSC 10586) TaxID=413071 RepID=G9MKH1_HYPVG|nr:uncharacterized protein TRIVIDRAFT_199310 [Trichoderma virens Gv29-8]EHK24719.1 hypothetical protein TRIVIDRAFT_199310 [Trichoderma virens Gv29-8]UKZ54983.1 hypothetical protein TrVGV298_008798 [Trichoderma virens]
MVDPLLSFRNPMVWMVLAIYAKLRGLTRVFIPMAFRLPYPGQSARSRDHSRERPKIGPFRTRRRIRSEAPCLALLLGPLGLIHPVLRRMRVGLPAKSQASALQGTPDGPSVFFFLRRSKPYGLVGSVDGAGESMGVDAPQKVSVTAGEMICLTFKVSKVAVDYLSWRARCRALIGP